MKQKIIIKVSMHCSKCRTKALKIAAVADGVISVALHGPEKDKLLINGDGIDVACLTNSLRKKLCHASIETVEEVKETKQPPPKPTETKSTETKTTQTKTTETKTKDTIVQCCPRAPVEYYTVVPDPYPGPCTIL